MGFLEWLEWTNYLLKLSWCTSTDSSRETHSCNRHSFCHIATLLQIIFPAVGMKEEQMEGGFRSWSHLAGSRKTTELAAFRMKSCLHPLCCKIRFPLFSKGQRPWKHLCLPRSPEAQSLPAPALLLRAAPLSHLGAGWREMINACKTKAARSWVSLTLYPEEPWEAGRISVHLPRN